MASRKTPLSLHLTPTESLQHPVSPPSPTFSTTSFISSMSWLADKAPQDLIPMIKSAYSSLREKEKDLTLAAEIGKQLLTANVQLEQNYHQLLQQQQQQPSDDESPDMHYSMNSRQVIIEVLEQKNIELNERLESLSTEHATMKTTNVKRTKQLEAEMIALKSDLEMATSKIQELEWMNQKQQQQQQQRHNNKETTTHHGKDVDHLLSDIQRLEVEQQQALAAKQAMESKLATALQDLHQLKQQFDTFEFTEAGYKALQQTYDRQFQHITELNQSLEDHRAVFQKLQDRGMHSLASTPCPSVIMKTGKHTLMDELGSEWNKQLDTAQQEPINTSTSSSSSSSSLFPTSHQFFDMDPFESLLTKAAGIDNSLIDDALQLINQLEQNIEQPSIVASHEDDDDEDGWTMDSNFGGNSVDDVIDLHGGNSVDGLHMALVEYSFPSQDLYPDLNSVLTRYDPSMTRPGLIRQWVSKALQRLWRWFRFALVLSTAVMISVWSGPDEMLLAID
ncbi:hypothetical protein BC941DRAFT_454466 [Chlamydoabsidia padenii]|nr:hypothetical protein BC941DRAFT_454466 [Chlamydoabsidia padenii]